MEKPGTVSALYAVEVPAQGGQTQWCNCCVAYEALDGDTRARLAGLNLFCEDRDGYAHAREGR